MARELYNHLDVESFDTAIKLQLNLNDYHAVKNKLLKRFGDKTGSFGRHQHFVNRTRLPTEPVQEYMESLEYLADKVGFKDRVKYDRLVETFTRNTQDIDAKKKAIK